MPESMRAGDVPDGRLVKFNGEYYVSFGTLGLCHWHEHRSDFVTDDEIVEVHGYVHALAKV